jgi:hypothetical protein
MLRITQSRPSRLSLMWCECVEMAGGQSSGMLEMEVDANDIEGFGADSAYYGCARKVRGGNVVEEHSAFIRQRVVSQRFF